MNRKHTVEIRFDRCKTTDQNPWAVIERYNHKIVKAVELPSKSDAIAYGESMANVYGAIFIGYLSDNYFPHP